MPTDDPPPHQDTDWRSRARGARVLAVDASNTDVLDQLVALLLDPSDTAVTDETSAALLRRGDSAGVRPIAKAWAQAPDDEYRDHIYGQLVAHLRPTGSVGAFVRHCTILLDDTDPAVASGARQLLAIAQPWADPHPAQ